MSASYFDQLEQELRGAVPRVVVAPSRSRRLLLPRLRSDRLALTASLAVTAIVVVAVAVPLSSERGHSAGTPLGQSSPPKHRPSTQVQQQLGGPGNEVLYAPGETPTLAQLKANFAVLRRAQNPLDRSWSPDCGCGRAARQLTGLTRYIGTVKPGGYRIFFDVEQLLFGGQLNMAAGSYVMNVDVVARDGNVSSTSFGPNTQFTSNPFSPYDNVLLSVIPDGVASVSWTFSCNEAQLRMQVCGRLGSQTVTVPVHENAAAWEGKLLGGCHKFVGPRRRPICNARAGRVTWRAADGRVITTFPGFGNLPAAPFVTGWHGNAAIRALGTTSLAGAELGEAWRTAVAAINRSLGPAADPHVEVRDCGIQHLAVWTSPTVADPLTAFERDGRLVGYRYGSPVDDIGLVRGPGAVLETAQGVTIGQTIAHATRAYAGHLQTRAHRGLGTWRTTKSGTNVSGTVLPTIYPLKRVTGKNPINTVDAGDVGCTSQR